MTLNPIATTHLKATFQSPAIVQHVISANNYLWKVVGCRVTMLGPSRSGAQIMLEICEKYAKETNLEFFYSS